MSKVAILAAVTVVACVSFVAVPQVHAFDPQPELIAPPPANYPLPRFGFRSYTVYGVGERVTYVRFGGLAFQLGLEPGDMILRLNGFPLRYHGAWNDALRDAMRSGGVAELTIRNVRNGCVARRTAYLGGPGFGPVTPKSGPVVHHYNYEQPAGPVTLKSLAGPKGGKFGPKPVTKSEAFKATKKIAKLIEEKS